MKSPAPAALAPLTLVPVVLLVVMIFTTDWWTKHLHLGQEWERIEGTTWICVALASVFWLMFYALRPKRWQTWVCLALHIVFLGLTVFPGGIAIAWLMHWGSGPGW